MAVHRDGPAVLGELDAAITELRKVRSTGAVIGLLGVDDQFFVLLRPSRGASRCCCPTRRRRWTTTSPRTRSTCCGSTAHGRRRYEVYPEGALDILADIGLPAAELQVHRGEVDLYPDEQLPDVGRSAAGSPTSWPSSLDTYPCIVL